MGVPVVEPCILFVYHRIGPSPDVNPFPAAFRSPTSVLVNCCHVVIRSVSI